MNWTKKELALRPGVEALVDAVIEQWIKDGKPQDPGIKVWFDIHDTLHSEKCQQHRPQYSDLYLINDAPEDPESLKIPEHKY